MMGGWGPKTPAQYEKQAERNAKWPAEKPWRKKVAELEARIVKQDPIINLLKKHLKKQGESDLILDLVAELLEE